MPYSVLLKKLIAESNYSYNEIVDKCKENGGKIDKAYLSKLANNKLTAPSEEISRMLSKVFNVDERKLVIEGYLDKAPKEIIEAFQNIRVAIYTLTTNFLENELDTNFIEQVEIILKEEPLSDFIIVLLDLMSELNKSKELLKTTNIVNLKLEEPFSMSVYDNSMFPTITEGSKVMLKIKEKYENGSILAVKLQDNTIIFRLAFFNNDNIELIPLNKEFKVQVCKVNDIKILGEVTKIISNV